MIFFNHLGIIQAIVKPNENITTKIAVTPKTIKLKMFLGSPQVIPRGWKNSGMLWKLNMKENIASILYLTLIHGSIF